MQQVDISKAVKRNDIYQVREILHTNPETVNEVDHDGVTPLHCMLLLPEILVFLV
jgi:ankyrin repeat protein